jgi:hypothetical protein
VHTNIDYNIIGPGGEYNNIIIYMIPRAYIWTPKGEEGMYMYYRHLVKKTNSVG